MISAHDEAEAARFSTDQKGALGQLTRHFKNLGQPDVSSGEQGDERGPSPVIAVVGARGRGKTTVMRALRNRLATGVPGIVYAQTPIIDAAIIHEDQGIAATAIEALQSTIEDHHLDVAPSAYGSRDNAGRGGRAGWEERLGELRESYRELMQRTLMQQESHRRLAQDLAMSPGHYAAMVQKATEQRRKMGGLLRDYFGRLRSVHQEARDQASARGTRHSVRLVVYLDDLDLAAPDLVQTWARTMLADFKGVDVHWVIAFDAERMTAALSPKKLDKSGLDMEVGRSLLTKVIGGNRQAPLGPWQTDERRKFIPMSRGSAAPERTDTAHRPPTVGDLLCQAGRADMMPLLPLAPRALAGLYHFMIDQLAARDEGTLPGSAPDRAPIAVGLVLQTLAAGTGEYLLQDELTRWSPGRFGSRLQWDPEVRLSWAAWDRLAGAAAGSEPMHGLPVPKALGTVTALEPEALTEGLVDVALSDKLVSPYHLLRQMPFAQQVLADASITTAFPDDDVAQHFGLLSAAKKTALAWQRWSVTPAGWSVVIGPEALWQVYYGVRPPIPTEVFKRLYLSTSVDDEAATTRSTGHFTSASPTSRPPEGEAGRSTRRPVADDAMEPLPRRCRALMLLLAQLARAPFREIEANRQLWSPLAIAQASAAVTLSAYSTSIWGDEVAGMPPLYGSSISATPLIVMSERELDAEYGKLLLWLRVQEPPAVEASPQAIARTELHRALLALLGLEHVAGLVNGRRGSIQ